MITEKRFFVVETNLVQIGNSQGVRIPKALIKQVGLQGKITLEAQGNQLVIRSAYAPRHGWEEQFKAMAENGDDVLTDVTAAPRLTEWDANEWEW